MAIAESKFTALRKLIQNAFEGFPEERQSAMRALENLRIRVQQGTLTVDELNGELQKILPESYWDALAQTLGQENGTRSLMATGKDEPPSLPDQASTVHAAPRTTRSREAVASAFCVTCGTPLSAQANYCGKCGAPQRAGLRPPSTGIASTQPMYDPSLSSDDSGFFASLFDASFDKSITPKIVRASFILFIIFDLAVSLFILVKFPGPFLVRVGVAVILFFVMLVWVRLILESIMALHLIERNTRQKR